MTMVIMPLRKRADFLALRQAPSITTPSFRIACALRNNQDIGDTPDNRAGKKPDIRVGYTITKKIGNAVTRNRIRRRLKNVVARIFPLQAEPNADYVVIAYAKAVDRPFDQLLRDMEKAVLALKAGKGKTRKN